MNTPPLAPGAADGVVDVDVVVIGAGFAGLYAVHRAVQRGHRTLGVEAGAGVGGTWYWNRYPGARCDVESIDYSYSFDPDLEQEWTWSERYATQPEILSYLEHAADRYDLRRHYRFGERVVAAEFDDVASRWTVRTDAGTVARCQWLFCATGSLSAPNRPDIPGLDDFAGDVVMTAAWPEEGYDVTDKRVGVIGTGSSGIQSIPVLARDAARLTVFQRTPNYSVPAFNRPLTEEEQKEARRTYRERRALSFAGGAGTPHQPYPRPIWEVDEEERRQAFEARWREGGVLFAKTFVDQTIDERINDLAREFVEEKVRAIVRDPQVADDLLPDDHPIGTKRICTDSDYFETFNRDNVELVNLRRDPIQTITGWGVKTEDSSYELDVLVLATGFDAMTGAMTRMDIQGPRGGTMEQAWASGPITFLGVAVPGFPNLFTITGPGSPSVLANMVLAAEQQVDWLLDLVDHCRAEGHATVEARADAARAWTDHVDEVANGTLFVRADSWYRGANIDGKARVFMPYIGGFHTYIARCEESKDLGYAGFVMGS
ncbi:NAD(P)/FAD-dependent oxidoreductase [Nocardioides sp. YIM 152315]|uniref:flavin-containing monooxygenase n=1 Tax=Nocardioides sp. YIM 152315 TaxID=3031760 RepID=UPI0023DC6178|nr:NAD(P)/FAD-dependent oxidoreductase [Nocardioides sp. YIM 152315]MDF1604716.1 NAD(P)/FAD-dependent oxidoreductase [Nocardioides sp. YIM 152315]